MARAKAPSRTRNSSKQPAGRRAPSGLSPLQQVTRTLSTLASFLSSPVGLAIVAVLIIAVALPWTRIGDVIDAFRRAAVRTTGIACFGLVIDALLLLGASVVFTSTRRSFHYWRCVAGAQLLGLFAWGVLGLLRPHVLIAGINLATVSAGGRIGADWTSGIAAAMVWLCTLPAGLALIAPRSMGTFSESIPVGLRKLWAQRLPQRAWARLRPVKLEPLPDRPLQTLVRTYPPPELDEQPASPATIEQGAASAFRRSQHPAPAKVADTEAPKSDPPQPVAPSMAAPSGTGWVLPASELLSETPLVPRAVSDHEVRAAVIVQTLASFGVDTKVVQINQGPTVTQFGLEPGWDIKTKATPERDATGKQILDRDGRPKVRVDEVSRLRVSVRQVLKLQNDLALALAAPSIRIEAPVPGKSVIGIEVPNSTPTVVSLRSVIESPHFLKASAKSKLAIALGMGVSGEAIVADLARMPHLLIAGSTGSGKSVCINAIVACLLMHATPEEVRFILIDPKRVEMAAFELIPHLALSKIITEMDDVPGVLQGVIAEMDSRYKKFEQLKVRNLEAYNKHPKVAGKLPQWVVVIDELADLMMAVPFEVERQICRLAQLARATGIHLVVATQRPSVDVITGLIKANFPTRIAFAVSSQVDSRTILDGVGAEKLLGRGDMLFMATDEAKPRRLQGVYVSDQEIERLTDYWGAERWERIRPQTFDHLVEEAKAEQAAGEAPEKDELLEKARALASEHQRISASMLQRRLRIGYPRAARLMDALEDEGIVAAGEGGASRDVLASEQESVFGDL